MKIILGADCRQRQSRGLKANFGMFSFLSRTINQSLNPLAMIPPIIMFSVLLLTMLSVASTYLRGRRHGPLA